MVDVDHERGRSTKRRGKKKFFWDSSKSHFWNETAGRWGFSNNMSWIWLPAENTPFRQDDSVFPAWLLYVVGTAPCVPHKNAPSNKALTGFAMPHSCTCPAVSGPYPMVICETCYNLLSVSCPSSGKNTPFWKSHERALRQMLSFKVLCWHAHYKVARPQLKSNKYWIIQVSPHYRTFSTDGRKEKI